MFATEEFLDPPCRIRSGGQVAACGSEMNREYDRELNRELDRVRLAKNGLTRRPEQKCLAQRDSRVID